MGLKESNQTIKSNKTQWANWIQIHDIKHNSCSWWKFSRLFLNPVFLGWLSTQYETGVRLCCYITRNVQNLKPVFGCAVTITRNVQNLKLVLCYAVTLMGNVQNRKLVFICAVTLTRNIQNMKLMLCCAVTLVGYVQNMNPVFSCAVTLIGNAQNMKPVQFCTGFIFCKFLTVEM